MIELKQILIGSNSVKTKRYNRYCCYTLLWCVKILTMRKAILHTENGVKELDHDVANYIQRLTQENQELSRERNSLKLKVFELEFKLSRGWFYRVFLSNAPQRPSGLPFGGDFENKFVKLKIHFI